VTPTPAFANTPLHPASPSYMCTRRHIHLPKEPPAP
jgi:hypothetical protein